MENQLKQTNKELILTNDENTVTIINYMWYDKPYDVLIVDGNESVNFTFPKDGVYEIYQITLSEEGLYKIEDNSLKLKADDSVLLTFNKTPYNKTILEKFISDESGKSSKVICYTSITNTLNDLIVELLDMKIKGYCALPQILVERRDLLKMSIAALKYFASIPAVKEAQRIIEIVSLHECSNIHLKRGCNC